MQPWVLAAFSPLVALTDLGNVLVVLPVAGVAGFWVWRVRDLRTAMGLALLLAALILLIGALKFAAWSHWGHAPGVLASHYRGAPSGHAALASFVYGGLGLLCARAADRKVALGGGVLFGGLALLIAASRVALGAHPGREVLSGLVLGLVFLLPAVRRWRRCAPGHELGLISATLLTAVLALLSGLRFHQEQSLFLALQGLL